MSKLTIRQHYVSQVYMGSWCDKNGQLDALDKNTGRVITPPTGGLLHERYYYEKNKSDPDNELENKFGIYEGKFGPSLKFVNFVIDNAINLQQPVGETLANMLEALPHHAIAIKEFAATAYFRTPGALKEMRKQLASDSNPLAGKILKALASPYVLTCDGFDATLLERFHGLNMFLGYAAENRLHTNDWPCYPLAGGESHANFGYDIGNHEAAFAGFALTPRVYILFLSNAQKQKPIIIGKNISGDLVRQANNIALTVASRWVLR